MRASSILQCIALEISAVLKRCWGLRSWNFQGNPSARRMPRGVKKENLPSKICAVCNRPFTWRKKWERCWDEVQTCSDRCKNERRKGKNADGKGSETMGFGTQGDTSSTSYSKSSITILDRYRGLSTPLNTPQSRVPKLMSSTLSDGLSLILPTIALACSWTSARRLSRNIIAQI